MVVKKLRLISVFFLFLFVINISYSLTTLTVTEEDLVKIQPTITDPDQDTVFIYYSPPLNESGEWQTTLDDAGTYHTEMIASDGVSQTEEEIIILVKNKNQPPEIEDKRIMVEETEIIDLKELIGDPDDDSLKLIFQKPFNQDGVWQTTYDDAGIYQTEIIASDLEYKTVRTIEIKVKDKNQQPEIISSFSEEELVQLNEDSDFRFSISVKDGDKDDILTYSWRLEEKEISRTHSFNHHFDFESSGEYRLTLIVSDQKSEIEEDWILKINDVNRPPEIKLTEIIIDEGEKIILQLPEVDVDGDIITYAFQSPFENGSWQTTYDDAGAHTSLITAFDGDFTTENEIKITINEVDRSPVIDLDEKIEIDEDEKLEIDMEEFISDPDGDKLTIYVDNLPSGAIFSDNKLEWNPGYDFIQRKSNFFTNLLNRLGVEKCLFFRNKEVKLSIRACGKELCADHVLEIQINNVNRKPLLEELGDITLVETETLFLEPKASDPDNDFIRYQFEGPFDSNGEWQTTYGDAGAHTLIVTASDGDLTDTKEVKVTVLNKNRLPTLKMEKDYFKLNENQLLSFKVGASDPDGDELTIYAEDLPPGASFKNQIFSWTPPFDTVEERKVGFLNNLYAKSSFLNRRLNKEYKQFVVNFIASDKEFDVVHPITITIKNVNRAPEITEYSPAGEIITMVDEPVIFSVTADDADGDELTYQWDFGLWEKTVKGPDTIKRTFKMPGMKTIKMKVSDGTYSVEQEWTVKVKPLPVLVEQKTPKEEKKETAPETTPKIEEPGEKIVPEKPQIVPAHPEQTPCPQPVVPPKAPFRVYVVSS
jgi:PKD repeat protein